MRHRMKGRKLGRNSSHRKAMFKNMATSLILSIRPDEDEPNAPKVPGRIVTTVPKAKELRPRIEKLITLARKGRQHELAAAEFATQETRGSEGWRQWREGEGWQKWVRAKAPAVAARRRAFAVLRSKEAVDILFSDLAEMFEDRPGGYTRIVRLPTRRLGDGGQQALIEFTGENDRPRLKKSAAPVVRKDESPAEEKSAPTASASSESETSASPAKPDSESAESSESAADESSSESNEKQ